MRICLWLESAMRQAVCKRADKGCLLALEYAELEETLQTAEASWSRAVVDACACLEELRCPGKLVLPCFEGNLPKGGSAGKLSFMPPGKACCTGCSLLSWAASHSSVALAQSHVRTLRSWLRVQDLPSDNPRAVLLRELDKSAWSKSPVPAAANITPSPQLLSSNKEVRRLPTSAAAPCRPRPGRAAALAGLALLLLLRGLDFRRPIAAKSLAASDSCFSSSSSSSYSSAPSTPEAIRLACWMSTACSSLVRQTWPTPPLPSSWPSSVPTSAKGSSSFDCERNAWLSLLKSLTAIGCNASCKGTPPKVSLSIVEPKRSRDEDESSVLSTSFVCRKRATHLVTVRNNWASSYWCSSSRSPPLIGTMDPMDKEMR
mmetsp:Transcript_31909/g.67861  ORF Transcript_31909/g.67861 Transcript_31909/m.67861 type:complete len:373 (-) Transcript_31909:917-2035(-)